MEKEITPAAVEEAAKEELEPKVPTPTEEAFAEEPSAVEARPIVQPICLLYTSRCV